MDKKELQNLAQKIQLEISEKEWSDYLKIFENLEKLLTSLKNLQIGKNFKLMKKIDVGCLTLKELESLKKNFHPRISKKNQKKNSLITNDGFVLFRKAEK